MEDAKISPFYQSNEWEINPIEEKNVGCITEQDKLLAGKQILCGLAFIYICTF
jgi:hypothetical protein